MRYLPHTQADRAAMLSAIGVASIDDLFAAVPSDVRLSEPPDLPHHAGEIEVEHQLSALAGRNVAASSVPFFVGCGAYKHHIPASVDHLIQRSEFLTAYTPYQPEIAQGTLQVLFEFQTQVALLTGMEVANASMYDGSTGCGEAVLMAHRLTRRSRAVSRPAASASALPGCCRDACPYVRRQCACDCGSRSRKVRITGQPNRGH